MTLTYHPVVAFENQLQRPSAVLASADATDSDFPISNLAVGNLGDVAALTGTTTNQFVLDLGVVNQPVGAVFLRFIAGWEDIASIHLEADDEDTFTSPPFDQTYTDFIPQDDEWDINIPRRPHFQAFFEPVEYQYWRVTIVRTGGSVDLELGAGYFGPHVPLNTLIDGIAAYGLQVETESASEEEQSDLDIDFYYARSQRRIATLKLEGSTDAKATAMWLKKLQYAGHHSDVLYCYNPLVTDAGLIQYSTIWGKARLTGFNHHEFDSWEGSLVVRERT
jgi:hypothetical protein